MVHAFECLNRYFALDVESGSVFEISHLAKLLIERKIFPQKNAGDISCFNQKDIAQTQKELDTLIEEGILFSPPSNPAPLQYDGIVKSLCLNISHACNLKCAYCFANEGSYCFDQENNKPKAMTLEIARAAINFLIAHSGTRKQLEVDFFGGEPLLCFDVVKKTVEYARSQEKQTGKGFRFTMTTNGYNLNDEIIDYLNKEMYNVVISIDGRKEIHDQARRDISGKPTYDRVLENAKRFRNSRGQKQYYIRGTFTSKGLDFAKDVIALNDAGFDQISLEPVVLPDNNPLALKENHLGQLKEQYELLAQTYLKRRKSKDTWFSFFHFKVDFQNATCLKKRMTGCGAGSEYLAVAPDGTLYPCHRFDGKDAYRMGNVQDGSLNVEIAKKFAQSNLATKEECANCFCKYYCSGGCAANSIEYGGGIDKPYRLSCELMRKRIETAIAIYVIEQESAS